MKRITIAMFVSMAAIFITGCQNHIRTDILKEKRVERSKQSVNYFLNVNQEVIHQPIIKFTLNKETMYHVVEFEDLVKNDLYTPYKGVYEFYEFPGGLLVLPGTIVVNVVDFALLGLLPNRFTDDLLDISFTGMNPFLNWESEERSVTKVLSKESKEIDKRNEVVKQAAGDEDIVIESDFTTLNNIKTDTKGIAKIYVHDPSVKFIDNVDRLREINVYVRKGEPEETHVNLLFDRKLRMRLVKARSYIDKYRKNKTGASLAKLVMEIEELSFPRLALTLERDELKQADSEGFTKEFNDTMIKLSDVQ